jgi:nitrous oxidase accessory protein NosD
MSSKLRLHAARPTRLLLVAILGLVAGLAASSGGSTAKSTNAGAGGGAKAKGQPKCGDTITADTTLHKDLVDCPNNGIVIGADNITLNLNGHLIDGDGTPTSGCDNAKEFCDTGIVNEGHDGVTVMHGSIRQFGGGVTLFAVRQNRVQGISTSGNHFDGIQLFNASQSLVRDSSGQAPNEEIGLGLFSSHHVRVVHNSFRDTATQGIVVSGGARNLVEGNKIRGAGKEAPRDGDGVAVDAEARHTILRRNSASQSKDDGFDIESRSTKLTKNVARSNGDLGIEAVRGVTDGGGNKASGNGDRRQCIQIVCN